MRLRAPYVRRGQRLTPTLWNELARSVNQGLSAPRDLDSGVTEPETEAGDIVLQELSRLTETVRVYNPDDAAQFVDVERITQITTLNQRTGESFTTKFN